jgi:hypothetical protein
MLLVMAFATSSLLVLVLLVLAVNTLGVAASALFMLNKMSRDRLIPLQPGESDWFQLQDSISATGRWAAGSSFSPYGFFRTPSGALIALWTRQADATHLGHYIIQRQSYFDFVTLFDNKIGLTTGSTPGAQLFPKWPGSYSQSFSSKSLDQQYALHHRAVDYLKGNGARMRTDAVNTRAHFDLSIQKQLAWVKTYRFWPVRAIYWFWIKRFLRHNVAVEEQVRRGWVVLPPMLPPRFEIPGEAANWSVDHKPTGGA